MISKSKKKKLLFIAHGNNDLDHYLPIVYRLNDKDEYNITILFIESRYEVLTNTTHKHIIEELTVHLYSFTDLFKLKILIHPLKKLQRYCKRKYRNTPFKDLLYSHRYYLLLLKAVDFGLKYFFIKTIRILVPKRKMRNFLKNNTFSMMVIDIMQPNQGSAKKSLLSYVTYNLMKQCRKMNIPIFMISHGATIRYNNSPIKEHDESLITPDILAICNQYETSVFKTLQGENTNIKVLGDIRYDYKWIKKLEDTASKKNYIKKAKNKFVILNVAANLTFINDASINTEINADILKLLNDFENAELWIKTHPRYPSKIGVWDNPRVKIFHNDVDTNALLPRADVVISALSGILFQPIILGKRVIFYDKWKKFITSNTWTVFDKTPCVLKASNYEQLRDGVAKILNNSKLEEDDIDEFYTSFVSGGLSRNESIIERYIETIDHIFNLDRNSS